MSELQPLDDQLVAQARRALASAGVDLADERLVRAILSQPVDLFSPLAATSNSGAGSNAPGRDAHPDNSVSAPAPAPVSAPPSSDLLRDYVAESVRHRRYEPPPARIFSPADVAAKRNCVNHKTKVHALVEHPYGAFVEYPQTGTTDKEIVAHRFPVDPERPFLPHHSFQYSLGGHMGAHEAKCSLINDDGRPVDCRVYSYQCTGVRACSFQGSDAGTHLHGCEDSHSFTSPSRQAAQRAARAQQEDVDVLDAEREVFTKTLAFFCSIRDAGCLSTRAEEPDGDNNLDLPPRDVRAPVKSTCGGKLELMTDTHGRYYIRCAHWTPSDRTHLVYRNLEEYDILYLSALVSEDTEAILRHEQLASSRGYGPLAPCGHVKSCRSQAQLCPHWHRGEAGLVQGSVIAEPRTCQSRFRIYIPDDLYTNPNIVVLCIGPHSHAAPERSMTPPPLREAFKAALSSMDWRLADATPLRVVQDGGFMTSFRKLLNWTDTRDPTLSELHPSLGNLDHAAYIIEKIRASSAFPCGTDFEGAQHLYREQLSAPVEQRYVRFADRVTLPGREEPVRMIVCMSPAQSRALAQQKRIQTDIAFNRVKGFLEFEMVAWDATASQSITLCRAFTECQSAEAHHALFHTIFKIAEQDTGWSVRFRHIHGDGLEIWTADEHKGQALGLGLFAVDIARGVQSADPFEPDKRVCDLGPYDHLARFFRLCIVHYKRNVRKLQQRGDVADPKILDAMYSLASSQPLRDFAGTLDIIRKGNKKVRDWLHDKEVGSPFALPALYQPLSKIPLHVWLAGASTSNGVEQAHRDVNRDGKGLPLVGGIQRGMQHDVRETESGLTARNESIAKRYRPSTHGLRQARTVQRQVRASQKKRKREDENTEKAHARVQTLQTRITDTAAAFQHALNTGNHAAANTAAQYLSGYKADLQVETAALKRASARGSGSLPLAPLQDNGTLYRITVPSSHSAVDVPLQKRQRLDNVGFDRASSAISSGSVGPISTDMPEVGIPLDFDIFLYPYGTFPGET